MTSQSNPYADPLERAFEQTPEPPSPTAEPAYLRGLNAEQREAVLALDGRPSQIRTASAIFYP